MNKIFLGLLSMTIVTMLSAVSIGSNEASAASVHAQKSANKGKHRKNRRKRRRAGGGCQTLSSSTLQKKASQYNKSINSASKKYGVNKSLIKAVITIESCFKSRARGSLGEKGLMQLMPNTAKRLKVRNGYNVWQNVHGGTKYLGWLLKRYNGNMNRAIAAYNAGEGNIDKGRIPNPRYVKKVLHAYRKFSSSKSVNQVPKAFQKANKKSSKQSTKAAASVYVVKSGDTVYEVMRQTGTSVSDIIKLNDLKRPYQVEAGQQLKLKAKAKEDKVGKPLVAKSIAKEDKVNKPLAAESIRPIKQKSRTGRHYIVKSGNTVYEVMRQTGVSVKDIIRLNNLSEPYDITTGQSLRLR